MIITNGLADPSAALYNDPDLGLSPSLAHRGLSSVLLPLPMHFWRIPESNPKIDRYARRAGWNAIPAIVCAMNPERLYYGYEQIVADQIKLAREVKEGKIVPGLDASTKVHLLGHSLGGLAALAAVLVAEHEDQGLLDSCILLCSGSSLEDLVPESLKIRPEKFEAVRAFYRKTSQLKSFGIDTGTVAYSVFQHVGLNRGTLKAEILAGLSGRVHIIAGSRDQVNTLQGVQKLVDRFSVLTVPGLEHGLWDSDRWKHWVPYLADHIGTFLKHHPL
ncbi:MAG: alpha/beta fold hydrolase [Candidatus Eisenbacteria bacterium]